MQPVEPDPIEDALNTALIALDHRFIGGDLGRIAIAGHELRFPSGKARTWAQRKHADGQPHEPGTAAAFIALTRLFQVTTIYDVGALYGYFSLLAAHLLPEAHIVAFEPVESVRLGEVVALNGLGERIAVRAEAVSDRTHTASVRIQHHALFEDEGGDVLPLVALDDCEPVPDFIKIDVEGHQAKVMPGAMRLLAGHRPILIVELDSPPKLERFGTTNAAILQPLLDMGYAAYWCSDHRVRTARFEHIDRLGPAQESNALIVFVHPEGPARRPV